MAHYALIDNASGYIFWQGFSAEPIGACEQANADLNPSDKYEYKYANALASNEAGYHVYQIPADYREIEDGCDELEIQSVEQHERVAIVRCTRIDD